MLKTRRLIKNSKIKLKSLIVGYGDETRKALTELAIHYRDSQVQVITKLFTEFLENDELQKEFKKFSTDFQITGSENEVKTISNQQYKTTFQLEEDLYEKISSVFWDYKYTDRNPFVRNLIQFLYLKILAPEAKKENETLQKKLSSMGFNVKDGKIIMGGHWIEFGSPPFIDEKK